MIGEEPGAGSRSLARNIRLVGPGRLHALVDGVFAIAVTLLVLDLPTLPGSAHFAHRFVESWPSYAAYVVSFATIALIWIEHHGMMSAVQFVNRRFLERTLIFLLFVSIIPWPTALAAEHIRQSGAAPRVVALLYAATMMLMGLSMAFSWRYLTEHEQLIAEPARPAMAAGARRALMGSLAYVPAIVFALLVPPISFGIDAAIAVYFALSRSEVPGLIYEAGLKDGSA
jgi:uncharacterized membrane protein